MLMLIILFALAAVGGVTLATLRLKNRNLPMPLALAHGVAAAAGLVLLIVVSVTAPGATLRSVGLVLFIIAALGGFALFSFHLRKQPLPVPLMLVHGLAAVVAFLLVLISALR